MPACRILLLDDHPALNQGLRTLFDQEPDLSVVATFAAGPALLAFLNAQPAPAADVLLLDLHLPPPLDGLALLPHLRHTWPALRVLVFSSATSPELVAQAAAAGASGFLNKSAEADELLAAIRTVYAGGQVFSERQAPALPSSAAATILLQLRQLTTREREIIGLVREGCSTRTIAARLSLSEFTVSTHRRNLLQKLGLHRPLELVRFALDHGL